MPLRNLQMSGTPRDPPCTTLHRFLPADGSAPDPCCWPLRSHPAADLFTA
jgi:hypothetical protein